MIKKKKEPVKKSKDVSEISMDVLTRKAMLGGRRAKELDETVVTKREQKELLDSIKAFKANEGRMPEWLKRIPKPPAAKFSIGQIVRVSNEVCDDCSAVICGMEWGPNNIKIKGVDASGWVYILRFDQTASDCFMVSEQELIKWLG